MKHLFIIVLFLFHHFANSRSNENSVLNLNNRNFNNAVQANDFLLVNFYAPWCGHCTALRPNFAKAAKLIAEQDPHIKFGKVDATAEMELANKYDIKGYPTLKFFRKGNIINYDGGRQVDDIVNWVKKEVQLLMSKEKREASERRVAPMGLFRYGRRNIQYYPARK